MALNPKDKEKSTDSLTLEANNGATEDRIKEILSELVVRTVREWENPGWFTEWASTTSKKDAEDFLQNTLNDLIELELYEYCDKVENLKGLLEIYHSNYKKNNKK